MARRSFAAPSDFERDKSKPSLESLLDHYAVDYKPRTSQMVRCPIHGDISTPSCSVNLDKQVWNCHSCGSGGDAWSLIMQKEGVDFDGARTFAASNGLADADAGGGGDELPMGRYSRGGGVHRGSGNPTGNRPYVPRWRRS